MSTKSWIKLVANFGKKSYPTNMNIEYESYHIKWIIEFPKYWYALPYFASNNIYYQKEKKKKCTYQRGHSLSLLSLIIIIIIIWSKMGILLSKMNQTDETFANNHLIILLFDFLISFAIVY